MSINFLPHPVDLIHWNKSMSKPVWKVLSNPACKTGWFQVTYTHLGSSRVRLDNISHSLVLLRLVTLTSSFSKLLHFSQSLSQPYPFVVRCNWVGVHRAMTATIGMAKKHSAQVRLVTWPSTETPWRLSNTLTISHSRESQFTFGLYADLKRSRSIGGCMVRGMHSWVIHILVHKSALKSHHSARLQAKGSLRDIFTDGPKAGFSLYDILGLYTIIRTMEWIKTSFGSFCFLVIYYCGLCLIKLLSQLGLAGRLEYPGGTSCFNPGISSWGIDSWSLIKRIIYQTNMYFYPNQNLYVSPET